MFFICIAISHKNTSHFLFSEVLRATTYIVVYKLSIMKCRGALDLKTLDK